MYLQYIITYRNRREVKRLLFKNRKVIIKLSYNLNMKILNFNTLFFDNHIFMLKLLKLSGDKDSFIKLNIKSVLLNSSSVRYVFISLFCFSKTLPQVDLTC